MMKTNFENLVIAIGIPILIGSLSGMLAGNSGAMYMQLNQPTFAPPGWIFPIVWSILYVLMGVSSYLVIRSSQEGADMRVDIGVGESERKALLLYVLQLTVNFFWPIIFFQQEWYALAFVWLVILWVLIVFMIRQFYRISPLAAYLQIPYLLWVTFAGFLNLAIVLLN